MIKYRLIERLEQIAALSWQANTSMGADVPEAEGKEICRKLEVLTAELKGGKTNGQVQTERNFA